MIAPDIFELAEAIVEEVRSVERAGSDLRCSYHDSATCNHRLLDSMRVLDHKLQSAPFDHDHNLLREALRVGWRYLDHDDGCPMRIVGEVDSTLFCQRMRESHVLDRLTSNVAGAAY